MEDYGIQYLFFHIALHKGGNAYLKCIRMPNFLHLLWDSSVMWIPCIGCVCFTVNTLCSGLFEIWRFYVQYSGFKVTEAGIFFTETSDYFFVNSMVVIHTLFTKLTLRCRICWRVCSTTVTYDWFPVNLVNRDGCHMWDRKCSLFHDFTHSLCIYIT